MKTRKHHNNKALRQIKTGQTRKQTAYIAKKLNLKYSPTLS